MRYPPRPAAVRPGPRRIVVAVGLSTLSVLAVLAALGGAVRVLRRQEPAAPEPNAGAAAPAEPPPQVGDLAPDFTLSDVDGEQIHLSDWRGRSPVLIEFGSLSCPLVSWHADELDRLAHAYAGQAQFWFVYADEAHPGHGEVRRMSYGSYQALPQVRNYAERYERAQRMQHMVKAHRRMLVDKDGAASVAARYHIPGHGFVMVDVQGHISSYHVGTGSPNWRNVLLQQVGPGHTAVEQ